jgi:hypothetical protein
VVKVKQEQTEKACTPHRNDREIIFMIMIMVLLLKWRGGSRSITNLLFKRRQLMVSTVI